MGVAEYQLMRKVPESLETNFQIKAELRPDRPEPTM
jgi:hypothetical protein